MAFHDMIANKIGRNYVEGIIISVSDIIKTTNMSLTQYDIDINQLRRGTTHPLSYLLQFKVGNEMSAIAILQLNKYKKRAKMPKSLPKINIFICYLTMHSTNNNGNCSSDIPFYHRCHMCKSFFPTKLDYDIHKCWRTSL